MQAFLLGFTSLLYGYGYIRPWLTPDTYTLCSNNAIYTVDPTIPTADCISISKGRITFVGNRDQILLRLERRGILDKLYDSVLGRGEVGELEPEQIIIPGLADAHGHILEYGLKMQLPLDGAQSIQEVVRRVEQYVLKYKDLMEDKDAWIHGMGWDQTKWARDLFPTTKDLDSDILRGRRIRLVHSNCHSIWVSQRILDELESVPDQVDGGEVLRGSDGKPTGVFSDAAMDIIQFPPWSETQLDDYFNAAMQDALSYGLTSIHDAASSPEWLSFFKRKSESVKLPIRLYVMGFVGSDQYWGSQIERLQDYGKDGRLNIRSVKLFADGELGSWSSALLKPYSDRPSTSGIMWTSPEKLREFISQFYEDGWQVNVHCTGDRANRVILDILEEIITVRGANITEWRPRIEHAQFMAKEDLKRLGQLGVIASVQPAQERTSDMWFLEKRLGPERLSAVSAYSSQLEASPRNLLPLGSDFPVESLNPFSGFYSAITRLSHEGTSPHGPDGWFPDQRLTRKQALKGMTLDAAYASFNEDTVGSLAVGKRADFVVLDRDIMKVPTREILETKVVATVVDGGVVYGSFP